MAKNRFSYEKVNDSCKFTVHLAYAVQANSIALNYNNLFLISVVLYAFGSIIGLNVVLK